MYEQGSFIDKLINKLLSPFDRIFFNRYEYNPLKTLGITKDTGQKWLTYYYLLIHAKIYGVLEVVYDGYETQSEFFFVSVDTTLDDRFLELLKCWKELDRLPFNDKLRLGQYNSFGSLNADSGFRKKLWSKLKSSFKEDIDIVCKDIPTEYLTNELKIIFSEIDKLLVEHKEKKDKILFGDDIIYKKVSLNKEQNYITIKNGQPINITSNPLRLLKLMLENIGVTVSYELIAQTLNIPTYTKRVDNAVMMDIQQMKKDIAVTLIANGIDKKTANEIREYLEPIRKTGYIIRKED
ncbi:hypothetical protein A2V49_01225 [candidate division WWE3 bacterium RBG_19FT_COMBO_34_6]|uniref:Uncharacterized protein n=1 Tax=candidate division WWE3 bacterium RBG_19FT_COMBO_34_6 TaxID=1802612 RepID=A0A1F4UK21_UNCKA|nr:MAG: hypothetical protein A2V49_01225 [candidate division WWE3 bacterium RBG_19FT_COMBO_34_6]